MTKSCIKCRSELSHDHFHKDMRRPDGLYPYCKDCRRKYYGVKEMVHRVIGNLDGYMVVDASDYPCILLPTGRVRVHRYVAEKKLGRPVGKNEEVHHINGNKRDWKSNNIVVLTKSVHRSLEGHKRNGYSQYSTLTCGSCGKEKTYNRVVIDSGVLNEELYQCQPCYYKYGGPGGRSKLLRTYTC